MLERFQKNRHRNSTFAILTKRQDSPIMLHMLACRNRQTRQTQNLLRETVCGFKSHCQYQRNHPHLGTFLNISYKQKYDAAYAASYFPSRLRVPLKTPDKQFHILRKDRNT